MIGKDFRLSDSCSTCVDRHQRQRLDTLTDPERVRWEGGRAVVASYRCTRGHRWTTAWDLAHWLETAA